METNPVINRYSLYYLLHLSPLPKKFKGMVLPLLRNRLLGHFTLSLPLGNMYLIAEKAPTH
jgi:hypothetical protein